MSFTTHSDMKKHSLLNGHPNQDKQSRNDSKEKKDERKVYVNRNSVITDMMEVNHLQTIYNICHVGAIFLFITTLLYYIAEPSKMEEDMNIIKWNLSKTPESLMFCLLFHLFAFAFYEGFKVWIAARNRYQSKAVDQIFVLLFAGSYLLTLIVTGYYMMKVEFRPIWGFIVGTEQARIHMKIYSFVRECAPRVMQHVPVKDGNQEHSLYPTRKHYLYFLFAPTLLYRDSYPRTEKIRWRNVFNHSYNFFLSIFVFHCLMMRFCDQFKNVGIQPFKQKEKILVIAVSAILGLIITLLMCYIILHCWLNTFAELLRFGDREFYQDWWNATTAGQHYRKWNVVVRDWFHTYMYKELQKHGYGEDASRTCVFLISSVFHEYFLVLGLQFFYPIFGIQYALGGIQTVPLTRGKTGQFWGILTWFLVIFTTQSCVYHYVLEWYARINCPKQETTLDFFIPRMLDPSCQISDFQFSKFIIF